MGDGGGVKKINFQIEDQNWFFVFFEALKNLHWNKQLKINTDKCYLKLVPRFVTKHWYWKLVVYISTAYKTLVLKIIKDISFEKWY